MPLLFLVTWPSFREDLRDLGAAGLQARRLLGPRSLPAALPLRSIHASELGHARLVLQKATLTGFLPEGASAFALALEQHVQLVFAAEVPRTLCTKILVSIPEVEALHGGSVGAVEEGNGCNWLLE